MSQHCLDFGVNKEKNTAGRFISTYLARVPACPISPQGAKIQDVKPFTHPPPYLPTPNKKLAGILLASPCCDLFSLFVLLSRVA